MKKIFSLILICISVYFLTSCNSKQIKDKIEIAPANPKSGDEIVVYYDAEKTELKGATAVDLIVYEYDLSINDTKSYKMQKEGNLFTAHIKSSDNAKGLVLKFEDPARGNKADANDGKGYLVPMYINDTTVMPCAEAGFAYALVTWGEQAGIEMDKETAYNRMKEAVSKEPQLLSKYLGAYCYTIFRLKRDAGTAEIKKLLDKEAVKDSLSEQTIYDLSVWYARVENKEKAEKYKTILKEKYPDSKNTILVLLDDILQIESNKEKVAAIEKFAAEHPEFDEFSEAFSGIAYSLYKEKDYENAVNFMLANIKYIPLNYLSFIAENISEAETKYGYEFYPKSIEFAKQELENLDTNKPKDQSGKDWFADRTYLLADSYIGLASSYYLDGKFEEAVENFKKSFETFDILPKESYYIDSKQITRYINALIKTDKVDEAKNVVEAKVKTGEASDEIMDLLKEVFVLTNGSDSGYTEYLSKYEAAAHKMLLKGLEEELISQPAPDFTLNTIDGKEVSLSDFRGKTVIVDFWATWCGPCKKSFPAMQEVVNELKNDESVVFLFVNTWERVENKIENAKEFIKKNNYNFTVLMDIDNVAVTKFKVNGIPNKFVVDKDGNIRFNKSGFDGNKKYTIDEIKGMISLVK